MGCKDIGAIFVDTLLSEAFVMLKICFLDCCCLIMLFCPGRIDRNLLLWVS